MLLTLLIKNETTNFKKAIVKPIDTYPDHRENSI